MTDHTREQTAILETHSLTKDFKGFTAVKDINLSVQTGSIHALIGPNGAGKTTFFNLLTKFLKPTSGHIVYNDKDITSAGLSARFRFLLCFPTCPPEKTCALPCNEN